MNKKEMAIISLIIFATVVAWIVFGVYHTRRTSTVSRIQLKQVIPLTPTFRHDIINELKSREE